MKKVILYGYDGKPIDLGTEDPKPNTPKEGGRRKGKERQAWLVKVKRWMLRGWKFTLGIITIIGLAITLVVLVPRVSITPGDPVEKGNPFSASFTIASSNFFPLRDVSACFDIVEISVVPQTFNEEDRQAIANTDEVSCITASDWKNHTLSMDEKFTITPYTTFAPGDQFSVLAGADIAIVVDYQPWFIPLKRRQAFRFVTHRFADGSFRWYSYPFK